MASRDKYTGINRNRELIMLNALTDSLLAKLNGITAGAEPNNISDVNATALTDGGETSLHTHPGGGGSVFGADWKSQQNITLRSTNSTSFQQGQRLSTVVLDTGTYRIGFMTLHRINNGGQEVEVRLQINNSIDLFNGEIFNKEQKDTNSAQREGYNGFDYYIVNTPTALNIDIDYRSSDSGKTAELFYTRIEIWRVS